MTILPLSLRGAKRRSNLDICVFLKDEIATPTFGGLAMTERGDCHGFCSAESSQWQFSCCHCEERSDEAISIFVSSYKTRLPRPPSAGSQWQRRRLPKGEAAADFLGEPSHLWV